MTQALDSAELDRDILNHLEIVVLLESYSVRDVVLHLTVVLDRARVAVVVVQLPSLPFG